MPDRLSKLNLPQTDAIVVGSGPNGMAAAIHIAQAGKSVLLIEGADTFGGGLRSAALTLPGFIHDTCSSVYPLAACSPFFRSLPLAQNGLEWVFPPAALAHPFDDGSAAVLYKSVEQTAATLAGDSRGYERLVGSFLPRWEDLLQDALAPLHLPHHPITFGRFGMRAIRPAAGVARAYFRTDRARTFFSGLAAHSLIPLDYLSTAGVGIMLALLGHSVGWPVVRGGAQQLTNALLAVLKSLGGQVISGCWVESLDQLPPARSILLDVTPRQLLKIAGTRLSPAYRRKLERYRYGMGVFKIDWALHQLIPWRAPECRQAGTIHLGGSFAEICDSEQQSWNGKPSSRPFVLLAQPSVFDSSRAPTQNHTAWGYCHVPHGHAENMTAAIEMQIERFAPGFRDCIAARSVMSPKELEEHNPNLVGGDIGGGAATLRQLFFRPTASLYRTAAKGVYLCSSSTPPIPGVHGMCGYFAAEAALRDAK